MNRRLTGAILLFLMFLGVLFILPMHWVQISLPRQDGKQVAMLPAGPGDTICLSYLHSVEKTPVKGWFGLDKSQGLLALETWTTAAGTGLPNVVDTDRAEWKNGWLVIDEKRKKLPEISFFYWPINRLSITVSGNQVELHKLEPGSLLLIEHVKASVSRFLWTKIWR